jgi:hypothetical protein
MQGELLLVADFIKGTRKDRPDSQRQKQNLHRYKSHLILHNQLPEGLKY